jgi:hypothetical protein
MIAGMDGVAAQAMDDLLGGLIYAATKVPVSSYSGFDGSWQYLGSVKRKSLNRSEPPDTQRLQLRVQDPHG